MPQQQGPDGTWRWVNPGDPGPAGATPTGTPGPGASGPAKKKRRKWPWVIVALFAGFLLIGILSPKKVEPAPAADLVGATPTATSTAPTTTTTTLPRTTTTTAAPTTTSTAARTTTTTQAPVNTPETSVQTPYVDTPYVETPRYTPPPTTQVPYTPAPPAYTPPAYTPPPVGGGSVYYANCDAAKAAGVAPISLGQPGYRSGLDRDGDGIACDK